MKIITRFLCLIQASFRIAKPRVMLWLATVPAEPPKNMGYLKLDFIFSISD